MIENISQERINSNKDEFINLLRSTNREGIEGLINYLTEKTDFFTAPASSKYHGAFEGGLCEHSLWVYKILLKLVEDYKELAGEDTTLDNESLIITALLHDISKVNTYESTVQNKKIYSPEGSKYDEMGNYDWVPVKGYKMKDLEERFVFVNHESSSEFIIRQFIPLRIAESVAIMIHHGGIGYDSVDPEVITPNYAKYTLSMLLHQADMTAAYKFA